MTAEGRDYYVRGVHERVDVGIAARRRRSAAQTEVYNVHDGRGTRLPYVVRRGGHERVGVGIAARRRVGLTDSIYLITVHKTTR